MPPRVLSYPPAHDYVDRLYPEAARLVHRDEPWPKLPRFYDPDWLSARRAGWDLAHFHFTWEQYAPERFAAVLGAHRAGGTPVVWTVHDLRNPHTPPGAAEDDEAYLRLLARHAARVLTLTPGAAGEVHQRFGRRAEVVPHGPLLGLEEMRRLRRRRAAVLEDRPERPLRLLLHAKALRANLDWRTPLAVAQAMAAEGWPLRLDVLVHEGAKGRAAVEAAAGAGVRVHPHAWLAFSALCERLLRADALLLPYRWGTHSGLLELCADLGVPVVAGDVGYLREQAPMMRVRVEHGALNAASLRAALKAFLDGGEPAPVPVEEREADRAAFRAAHAAVYASLLKTPS